MRKIYNVIVDRPMGYIDNFGNIYPVNYGYIPGIIAGDGEEQDAYIISKNVTSPVEFFSGRLVAIIHREDDVEDKWIITSETEELSIDDIKKSTNFLEKFFKSKIEIL